MDLTSVGYRLKHSRVGELLDRFYITRSVREVFKSVEYALAGGVFEISVAGQSVRYPVDSKHEFGMLRHLAVTERPVIDDFAAELRATDTVYDVGAHLGLYTILAGEVVTAGDIVAFELVQANAERLDEMAGGAITVVGAAISDEAGIEYDPFAQMEPGMVTGSIREPDPSTSSPPRTTTIDEIVPEYGQPNVVKVDVEGHELAVLQGGSRAFSDERCRIIYLELHGFDDREAVVEQLHTFGFDTVTPIHTREDQEFLKAIRER